MKKKTNKKHASRDRIFCQLNDDGAAATTDISGEKSKTIEVRSGQRKLTTQNIYVHKHTPTHKYVRLKDTLQRIKRYCL